MISTALWDLLKHLEAADAIVSVYNGPSEPPDIGTIQEVTSTWLTIGSEPEGTGLSFSIIPLESVTAVGYPADRGEENKPTTEPERTAFTPRKVHEMLKDSLASSTAIRVFLKDGNEFQGVVRNLQPQLAILKLSDQAGNLAIPTATIAKAQTGS